MRVQQVLGDDGCLGFGGGGEETTDGGGRGGNQVREAGGRVGVWRAARVPPPLSYCAWGWGFIKGRAGAQQVRVGPRR